MPRPGGAHYEYSQHRPSKHPNALTEGFNQTEARIVHIVPVFNIFSGRFGEKDVVWLGAAERLDAAREDMFHFAENRPGKYFVFARIANLSWQRLIQVGC
jgi:hypothetical protein